MSNVKLVPADVLEDIELMQSRIKSVQTLLRRCTVRHANVALLPRATVDEMGNDNVFDEVKAIDLIRKHDDEALEYYCKAIDIQLRHSDVVSTDGSLSQIGARRMTGIIHVIPTSEADRQQINKLIGQINGLKIDVKNNLKILFPKRKERSRKFFHLFLPDVFPKSVTTLLPFIDSEVHRVHFSWLANGFSQEKWGRSDTIDWIKRINSKKLSKNPELNYKFIEEADIKRLGNRQTFARVLPAKINPRFQVTKKVDGRSKQLAPQRAVLPLLLTQSAPILKYGELSELSSMEALRLCTNKKRVSRIPVIEEYGLYTIEPIESDEGR